MNIYFNRKSTSTSSDTSPEVYPERFWARNGRETLSLTLLFVTTCMDVKWIFILYFNRRSELGVFPVVSCLQSSTKPGLCWGTSTKQCFPAVKNNHLISAQVAINYNVRGSISHRWRSQILSRYTSPELSELVDVPGSFRMSHIDMVQIPTFGFMP